VLHVASEIDEIISVKKFLALSSTLSYNRRADLSQTPFFLISPIYILPVEVVNRNMLSY
jgi:hypothetical protein